ncbi:vacuolar protein sorting-associated protein 11 homolog isoform X2 [Anneissia japonica]|uniref:vacuolar protein sorting-associated protein 11 homolog isoform X2 n=1 Tax=Anneissia japonica TaxID=1529436 RepID=UPI00142566BE|nr:vacuolar protein sorting-associated protein 11 homolog isoform X2 [Anneissia japonica]
MKMAFLQQWRRFNFFDKEVVKHPDTNQIYDKLKGINISVCTSGKGQIIVGDYEGNLYFIDRNLQISSFPAYEQVVTHIYQLRQHNVLVTIGQDESGINPVIKVWNFDKVDKMGIPKCSRITRALPGTMNPSRVTALSVSDNMNMMAVGFEDGTVTLIKGDVTVERHSKSKTIHGGGKPVTGLSFRHTQRNSFLFVVTENMVLSYNVTGKDARKEVLDEHGCPQRCTVMSDSTQDNQLIIGRHDAVYFYHLDGRGPCLAFEGEKRLLHWYRGYLIIVGKDSKNIPRVQTSGQTRQMDIVTVYDIQNKFIAYSGPFPEVVDVVCEWGSLYVIAGDKLFQLPEKDTQTKLEMLFKKNLYVMAINLAKSQHYDEDGLVDIFTQYGDHLYNKGDHDGAIGQYIRTIGNLEPSYVIRKFLDAQRIHNLTAYLQALHTKSLANEDHTTLLLNCYTKLKDNTKLDEFIMTKEKVDFDVETAIKVCRQAGYYKHALFLAEKHGQHDWYLKIQLEDIKDYQKALQYISRLSFEETESNMKKYGKTLMSEVPTATTELLKLLCTDYKPIDSPIVDQDTLAGGMPTVNRAAAEEFIHIFVNNSRKLMEFLEHMTRVQPNSPEIIYNTLLELYMHDMAHEADSRLQVQLEQKSMSLMHNVNAGYDIDQALVLCQMHDFKKGILYLYEKAKLYQQILRYHMDHDEYVQVIETCKRYGTQDSSLWVQTLAYFARKEESCKPHITEVLSQVDKRNLMPPLLVIQTLAHNSTATLSVVKDYIIRRLQQENDQINEDQRLIQQYQQETEKMKGQIEDLKASAKIFQVSTCSICNHALELPSVHFLCQHSYHQHCFEGYAENDQECPVCAPENKKVLDIIRAQEQSRDLHEQFHRQLEKSSDGFSVVADYFGRGVFNKVTLVTESSNSQQRKAMPESIPIKPLPQAQIKPISRSNSPMTAQPQRASSPQRSSQHSSPSRVLPAQTRQQPTSQPATQTRQQPRHQPVAHPPRQSPRQQQVSQTKQAVPQSRQPSRQQPSSQPKQQSRSVTPNSAASKNPFDEDDSGSNPFDEDINYDKSLNPFE